MFSSRRTSFFRALVYLAVLISLPAAADDYDALCDEQGNVRSAEAANRVVHDPARLERLYADALRNNTRAARAFAWIEKEFELTGQAAADYLYGLKCTLSVHCRVKWDHLDFLAKDRPGAVHLREVVRRAFEQRAKEKGIENQLILSTVGVLMSGVVLKSALVRAELKASVSPAGGVTNVARGSVWALGPTARGVAIEEALGSNLPANFPVIDRFVRGLATSIKSLDLGSKSYQNITTLTRVVMGYIDEVAAFNGRAWGGATIRAAEITGRALELAVPAGAGNAAQQAALQAAVQYGRSVGVTVKIIPF